MKRDEFVKKCVSNPKEAARILKNKAEKLESCKKITDTSKVLSEILFISDRTVFRDCKK
jgi:hypothetical protein